MRRTNKNSYLIVDGYNIINAWDGLKEISKEDLESAREKLIHYIIEYAQYTGKKAIIVFDAYNVKNSKEKIEERKYITNVYTKEHQTADSYIEKYISSLSKYDDIEVATSDYAEQQIILGKGASRISARELKLYVDNAMVKINGGTKMKFRTKPCEIEAVQWTGENLTEILRFTNTQNIDITSGVPVIKTLEGDMRANVGDYIIRGLRGEYYPCKPDVFQKKYEPCE